MSLQSLLSEHSGVLYRHVHYMEGHKLPEGQALLPTEASGASSGRSNLGKKPPSFPQNPQLSGHGSSADRVLT